MRQQLQSLATQRAAEWRAAGRPGQSGRPGQPGNAPGARGTAQQQSAMNLRGAPGMSPAGRGQTMATAATTFGLRQGGMRPGSTSRTQQSGTPYELLNISEQEFSRVWTDAVLSMWVLMFQNEENEAAAMFRAVTARPSRARSPASATLLRRLITPLKTPAAELSRHRMD